MGALLGGGGGGGLLGGLFGGGGAGQVMPQQQSYAQGPYGIRAPGGMQQMQGYGGQGGGFGGMGGMSPQRMFMGGDPMNGASGQMGLPMGFGQLPGSQSGRPGGFSSNMQGQAMRKGNEIGDQLGGVFGSPVSFLGGLLGGL